MSRITLGAIIWTVCLAVALPRAQDAPNEDDGALRGQAPSVAPTEDGKSATAPLANDAVTKDAGDAAKHGSAEALWKLGRLHADRGEHARAFAVFRQVADSYRDGSASPNARIAADAHLRLANYYLYGIPSTLTADPEVAHGLLHYAASYFRDPEAQYELGRLLLNGQGVRRNVIQAARWLQAAAKKDHRPAQALLGDVLLKGEGISRQAGLGLFWLMLANDGPAEDWIKDMYASALAQTTAEEHVLAYKHLEGWLKDQRQ